MKLKRNVMARTITALFGLSIAALSVSAMAAETGYTETIDYDVSFDDDTAAETYRPAQILAQFGPFFVVNDGVVEMSGVTDSATPAQFRAMMARFPNIQTIRMIDCPGSEDDDANIDLARMVHRAGISTHVPATGSIRSGAVELFLAGAKHTSEPGAEFGVHSWHDEEGREASDYAANDPVHNTYVRYYQDMGFDPQTARSFYAFTNAAAPASGVHYMTPTELSRFHLTN